jgi:hypothetical protein
MKLRVVKRFEFQPGAWAEPGQKMEVDTAYGAQLLEEGLVELDEAISLPKRVRNPLTQKAAVNRPGETATEL